MTAWFPLLLAAVAFAAWRCYVLTGRDLVLDKWRDRFAPVGTTRRDFLECPYCSGFWWAGIWTTALILVLWPPLDWWTIGLWQLSWWVAAAWVAIIEHLVDHIDG